MIPSLTISSPGSKFAPLLFRGDFEECIARASGIGFKAVELHIRDPRVVDRQAILKSLEKTGVVVSTIGTGQAYGEDRIFLTSFDDTVRNAAIRRIKDQIDFAAPLGAKVIIGLIKGPLPEEESKQEAAKVWAASGLRECAEYALKQGTTLTLEVINRYETNFLNTAEEADRFLGEVDAEGIGLHLDTFHMNIDEVSIEKSIRDHGARLVHVHLADSNRWAPGMGHLDFHLILKKLKEIGYKGYLGLECLPKPDPERAAIQGLRYLEELLSKIG